MSSSQINQTIAEILGWAKIETSIAPDGESMVCGVKPNYPDYSNPAKYTIPNYHSDLNACAEFERTLSPAERCVYAETLCAITEGEIVDWGYYEGEASIEWFQIAELITATAPQRCEAFLRLKGKWND